MFFKQYDAIISGRERRCCKVRKGLVIVFTGSGKGKTSAALGIALRASGHKYYVSIVQFVKGNSRTGEARAVERLKPEVEFLPMGKGFVNMGKSDVSLEEHREAAQAALAVARKRMLSGAWDILILDEINTALALGLIALDDVLNLIANRPRKLHIVLTGRDAHPAVIEVADLVTEMKNIKHPFDSGIFAQQGIDF